MVEQTVIFLVGLPCSGKSTWVKSHNSFMTVCSSDQLIEEYAASIGKTYSDVFKEYVKTADKLFKEKVKKCIESNESIIIDRTNLTAKGRKKLLDLFPNHYNKLCAIFNTDKQTILLRLQERNKTGKFISEHLINSMQSTYIQPSKEEGFHEIFFC